MANYPEPITGKERKKRVIERKKELGYTWADVADKVGITPERLQELVKQDDIRMLSVWKIAYAVRINPNKIAWDYPREVKKRKSRG